MPKLPVLDGKEIIRMLGKLGYIVLRQRGSHIRLISQGRHPITVPNHKVGRGLLRKILRDAELSVEEFLALRGK